VKKLTVQDYINLSQTSVSDLFSVFVPIFTNIVAAIVTVAIGVIIGWVLRRVIQDLSRAVNFERVLSGWPFYQRVMKSHEDLDITTVLGELLRWIAIIVFLIPAVASLQVEGANQIFSAVFAYITNVILASLYLLFGFVIAWFIQRVIVAVGETVGIVPAKLISNAAYLAIVVFATIQAALQLGVTVDFIRLFVIASFLAVALAFGLAGRDTAAEWIKKLAGKVK
jgi:hypothetical protein